MAFYELFTTVWHPDAMIDISKNDHQIFDFFVSCMGNENFLKSTKLTAKAQNGYTRSNIMTTDYLNASISVPVFSKHFVDVLGEKVKEDVDFFECFVQCQGEEFLFYVGKVKKFIPTLIDQEKSSTMTLAGGKRILKRAVFNKRVITPFFLARDMEFKTRWVVSDEFRALVNANKLAINFFPVYPWRESSLRV